MDTDDRDADRQRLVAELDAATTEFWKEFWDSTRSWVPFPRLPLVRPPRLHSGGIGMLVWSLQACLFAVGVLLTLLFDGAVRSLGLTLVVGSLFGIGAIGAQVWSVAYQRERALADRALGDVAHHDVLVLGARVQELAAQLHAPQRD